MADEQENTGGTEYSAVEQQALDQGWVPKDEFLQREDADEQKWVDAGEFLRRGELFHKIDSQNRKMKDMEKAMRALQDHNKKVEEAGYQRAIAELRLKKKTALEEGDADTVIAVEDRIDELKTKRAEAQAAPEEVGPHPEFTAWTAQNSWYETSTGMRAFADAVGRELAAEGKSPADVLKEVSKRVREEFPHKFRNPNRDKASAVEAGDKVTSSGTGGKSKVTLTEEEARIMNTLVRGGHITKEKYMADLAAIKERS